ncbi:DNA glycosylase [Suillus fuscotomentosus]|uniref:DNA-(apurinic or apyrimidinic site) lyase n=1 Tax=Suillus fuscotomentosus TaxID=1912939 RepID=A0AAD4EGN7_9AGAM|nr:DNA glycosylase [Suillus fuscotomentosus]KAG1905888.1 DNA glycosylase [Suillus fuscotomentosus]
MASSVLAGFCALPLSDFLKCGQSFRWTCYPLPSSPGTSPTHEYRLCLRDRVVCLRQSSDYLFYRSVFPGEHLSAEQEAASDEETLIWLKDYFQLDVDLLKLYDQWSDRDQVFNKLKSRFSGIRVLRQDPWENLVSFICSSNNNIPRITKMVHALCKQYSPSLISLPSPELSESDSQGSAAYHSFPPPSLLAAPEVKSTLRGLGFGYRADYIQRTAKMLVDTHGSSISNSKSREKCEEWLTGLRGMSTEAAREELLKFVGVGRKVADCVLLMSLDKKEVIPVDTHVHQIAIKHYGLRTVGGSKGKSAMTPRIYNEVTTKLADIWGGYAGWAHTARVLFTADLKAFSSFGIEPPTPATSIMNVGASTLTSSSSSKRKHSETQNEVEMQKKVILMGAAVAAIAAAATAVAVAHDVPSLLEEGSDVISSVEEHANSRRVKRRRC